VPNAKLVYNNSPSFNWTLNFRNQDDDMLAEGENMTGYDRNNLMDVSYDNLNYAIEQMINKNIPKDSSKEAGIFTIYYSANLPQRHFI
jgi:isocitrate lyase